MKGIYYYIIVSLLVGYSNGLSESINQPHQVVEGNLYFYPSQTLGVVAHVQLGNGPEEEASLYKEEQTETMKPFRFRITVDQGVPLSNLFVKVRIRKPDGFGCRLCDLRASECERLRNIPIYRKEDIVYKIIMEARAAMASGDIEGAKRRTSEVLPWATESKQVLTPTLDLADFLSKYKSERGNAVKILDEVEGMTHDAPFGIQERYWRLRRDAVMRLAGYNDFKELPLDQFAESVAYEPGSTASKAWRDLIQSFVHAYEANESQWSVRKQKGLTKDKLQWLAVSHPQKEEVKNQLKSLEFILGSTISAK